MFLLGCVDLEFFGLLCVLVYEVVGCLKVWWSLVVGFCEGKCCCF